MRFPSLAALAVAMVSPDKPREAREAEQSEEHAGAVRQTGPASADRHGA